MRTNSLVRELVPIMAAVALAATGLLWAAPADEEQTATDETATSQQEQTAESQPPAQPQVTYGEIVVTAQKREETLQKVPLSVTAFTAKTLQEDNVTSFEGIALRTPGMQYGNFPDQKLSPTSLRGIVGSQGSAGADPAVSQYVDDVYIGAGAGSFIDLFDLDRVEVLRGPQGLFYGRNSIGGAINYITRRPTNDFDAMFEATYGDYNNTRLAGMVSGPLVKDKLTAEVAATSNRRDGAFENLWLNRDVNTTDNWSVRGQLRWMISDLTRITFAAEHSEIDQESLFFETLKYNDNAFFVQVLDAYGLPRNTDPYDRKGYSNIKQPETLDLNGYSARFRTAIGNVGLTSITSYREHDYSSLRDTDASGLRWAYDGDPEQVHAFSEEARAEWSSSKASFLVGAYYFDQSASNQSFANLGEDLMQLLIGDPIYLEMGSNATTTTKSYAGFANMTYTLSDEADFSIGFRYTKDKKDIDYSQVDPFALLGGSFTLKAGDDWDAVTPAFNFRYQFTNMVMGYVNVSRGFKSGGFNDGLGSADGIAFGPEFLWNYELGLKSRIADGRVTANLALFYMDWSKIQITNDNPATPMIYDPIILNAGAAHSRGVEGEIMAMPNRNWTFLFNFAVIDAAYDGGTLPTGEPLDKIPFSPDYTANVSAEYRGALTGSLDWFAAAELLQRGEMYLTPDNQLDGKVGAHGFVNARFGVTRSDGRWRVTVWGKNLTDEAVKQRLFDLYDNDLIGQKYIVVTDPMTWGVTLGLSF